MVRRLFTLLLCLIFLAATGFSADRDPGVGDVKGIPKKHRYWWAVGGGAAVGLGIGILAPGGNKSAVKGMLIGGSGASLFWLATHHDAGGGWRNWSYLGTNTVLGGSLGWSICGCGTGFGFGALAGGGGTAFFQAIGTRNEVVADMTGAQKTTAASKPPKKP